MIGGTRLVFSLPIYGLLGLGGIVALARRPERTCHPRAKCLYVSAGFFTYILIRAANSPIEYLLWPDFFMVLGCVVTYLLTILYLTDDRQRSAIVCALLLLAVLEVFVGLRQFSGGDNWMPFGFMRPDSGRRASGMLISSIHLAGYLEAIGMFALSYAIWSSWKTWARVVVGYIAAMCYLGIAITGSRGGYLSALFSLLVFAAISLWTIRKVRPQKFQKTLFITAAVGAVVVVGAVSLMSQSALLRKRLSMIPQQLEKNGLDIRIYNWQAALDQFRVQPWFGTGAGTHIYFGRHFRRPPLQSDPIHAHSDYLELLAEYGIVGAAGMAAFLLVHLASGWHNYRTILRRELTDVPEWERAGHNSLALQIGALGAISAYLAHSVTDFNLHVPGHALIFAFIFGVIANPGAGVTAPQAARSPLILRWVLAVLGLSLFIAFLGMFPAEYWAEKARVALRDRDFPASIEAAQRALSMDAQNPELFFHLGGALRGTAINEEELDARVNYLKAAAAAYEQALRLFPQDVHTLVRYGQTLGVLGRFKEAEIVYRGALQLDPNFAKLHAYYARHLAIVGRDEEAEVEFEKAVNLAHGEDVRSIVLGTPLNPDPENPG